MTEDAEGCKRTLAAPCRSSWRIGRTRCRGGSRTAPTSRQCVVVQSAIPRRSFASFCASCTIIARFSVRFVPICAQNARNMQHSKKSFPFVFKYFLASFPLFFIFLTSRAPSRAGSSRFPSRRVARWASPTTMRPHYDHKYRLSLRPRLVKLEMQTETASHPFPYRARMAGWRRPQTFGGLRCPKGTRPKELLSFEVHRCYAVQRYADLPSHLQSG